MKLKKFASNPILSPNEKNEWENYSVCNPGSWYENGKFYLLYRAAGNDEEHKIHFGLATSEDGFHFERYCNEPVLSPSIDGPDAGCIEDPRIIKIDDEFIITYAYRPYPPGRYWLNKNNEANKPKDFIQPKCLRENLTHSGVLLSRDLIHFKRAGRITNPMLDDRDVIIFPEKINGKYIMLHRPKEWVGEHYGTNHPSIFISFSDDLMNWQESKMFIKGEEDWEQKVGGSTPPIKTDAGWLMLYHAVDDTGIYRVGAVLLDLNDPTIIIGRTKQPIMEPEYDYEFEGIYNGVVFPTGNCIVNDTLFVYYGGADKHCCLATCSVKELISHLLIK